ncbi:MAG: hypothetical protein FJ197_04360 [Gammaproteobacteria bacterium]|nr:hypothetical protein [Gammaproteobacteria bacterium]
MKSNDKIVHRGATMTADWPERIRLAQKVQHCEIGGEILPRIRYGHERADLAGNKGPCLSCGVIAGEFHVEGCPKEQCPGCGAPRFTCDCEPYEDS